MHRDFEAQVETVARRIAALGGRERARVYRMSWWNERVLDWAMARPEFKVQLFRFVDVFPALRDHDDVARHLAEYLEGVPVPRALGLGLDVAQHVPLGSAIEARVAARNIRRMAEQFVIGETPADAVEPIHQLWRAGTATTVDLLGEKTTSDAEADRYAARVTELIRVLTDASVTWAPDDLLERDDRGSLPRVQVSIKPSALAAPYEPLHRERALAAAKARIRPLLRLASERGALVTFDMEHYDVKDLTLALFVELLNEPEFRDISAGVVVQAYLRDALDDLRELVRWSASRPVPVSVRLVKGAYWDTETIVARAAGWPTPVFERKAETDASYERATRLLLEHHGAVRAAFASHNLRSIAHAIATAEQLGVPPSEFEVQMLYGMAEPIQAALRRLGLRPRVYAPVGDLVEGMAYLVRRLLENTSNESFVRHRFAEGRALDDLLAPPDVTTLPEPAEPARVPPTDPQHPAPYRPEPVSEWRRSSVRRVMAEAVARERAMPVRSVPALIGGDAVVTDEMLTSVDPGDHERVVATSASCGIAEADAAIAHAAAAAEAWRHTPVEIRSAVLFRTAESLRRRRLELAALEVFEAGKPWAEADADICEAIDFCEYYGREMRRLDALGTDAVLSVPGERNRLCYQGKGIAAVIAPWNFPLAIPTGMTVAALVAGNPVILKPAEQTPATAWCLVEALSEALDAAGAPTGTIQFLPGVGEVVGAHLVEHPEVALVAFTGSKQVGLGIHAAIGRHREGQRHLKRAVLELGGKNAVVIDIDADLDQAVPGVLHSAFGYAGQKCSAASRVVAVDAIYDRFVERLVDAAATLVVGHPSDMAVTVGPLIDADAAERLRRALDDAPRQGRVLHHRDDVPTGGWYVGPAIVELDDPRAPLARDELFGPLLTVLRARDFDDALRLANDTDYALTAGVYSRSPSHIERAAQLLRAGNVYVNRAITGAVVGRQPFGGYGLSGIGSKAGGPDYLLQFLDPRVVTETTLRQGFAPD